MPAFATLADALNALRDSTRGIHYIAGETNERRVAYAEMRGRALGLRERLEPRDFLRFGKIVQFFFHSRQRREAHGGVEGIERLGQSQRRLHASR